MPKGRGFRAEELMILILDLDGTLADTSHRAGFIEKPNPTDEDWDRFFDPELVALDVPIAESQDALGKISRIFDKIIFLTGRPEYLRKTTAQWLDVYFGMSPTPEELFMRPSGSRISNSTIKKGLLESKIKPLYGDQDWIFIDDEVKNLELFKQYGKALKAPECWDMLEKEFVDNKTSSMRVVSVEELLIDDIRPLHEVRNKTKLEALTKEIEQHGWTGNPVLVEKVGDGYRAWTGTHRLAAAKAAGLDTVPVVFVDTEKVWKALRYKEDISKIIKDGLVDATYDDEDRYKLLEEAGDAQAAALMQEEVAMNESAWNEKMEEKDFQPVEDAVSLI